LAPRLINVWIWVDAACRGQALAEWLQAQAVWELDVEEQISGVRGVSVLAERWIVKLSPGWLSRNRRMSKDYGRRVQTSETLIAAVMIHLLVVRLRAPTAWMGHEAAAPHVRS
jgi:putative transposase